MMKLICAKLADSVACMLGMATFTTKRSKIVMNPPESSTARPRLPRRGESASVSAGEGVAGTQEVDMEKARKSGSALFWSDLQPYTI